MVRRSEAGRSVTKQMSLIFRRPLLIAESGDKPLRIEKKFQRVDYVGHNNVGLLKDRRSTALLPDDADP